MYDNEGAVNELADAPPADSDAFVEDFDTDEGRMDGPAADFGEQSYDDSTLPENVEEDDPEALDGREGFIPRDRFDQVNRRAQLLEQELLREREQGQVARRAAAAGYRDVARFEHDDAWAKANDFEGIEDYLKMQAYQKQLAQQVNRGEMSDSMRAELLHDKQERLRTQRELQQVRGLLQSVQRSTLDQTIAAAKSQFDSVDPRDWAEIERLCRDIGRPEAVQRVIATFAPVLKSASRSAAQRAVIDHNARRASSANAPAPEGRGGGKAPEALPKMDPHQAKSRLLSDLLGFRKSL